MRSGLGFTRLNVLDISYFTKETRASFLTCELIRSKIDLCPLMILSATNATKDLTYSRPSANMAKKPCIAPTARVTTSAGA